jgi:hypothetical protein
MRRGFLNGCSENSLVVCGNVGRAVRLKDHLNRVETIMKKFAFIIAAVVAAGIAVPSIASAKTIIVKRGGMHHDHGWHHHDRKVVVIKHRH